MNPRREPSITFPPYRFAQTRQKSLVFYALTSGHSPGFIGREWIETGATL